MGEKKFLIAGSITLVLIFGCFLFLISPTVNKNNLPGEAVQEIEQEEINAEDKQLPAEETDWLENAETEVARFKEQYAMDIPVDDMVYQLQIRDAYEKMYGNSYAMEDVFMIGDSDSEIGDPSDDEADKNDEISMSTTELLQAYIETYDIDEARFQGMTPEQELEAIKVEYGSLYDQTDSAYYKETLAEIEASSEDTVEKSLEEGYEAEGE